MISTTIRSAYKAFVTDIQSVRLSDDDEVYWMPVLEPK